jgi:hypothetical protein
MHGKIAKIGDGLGFSKKPVTTIDMTSFEVIFLL